MLWGPQGSRETRERLVLPSSIEMVVTRMRVGVRVERREGSKGVGWGLASRWQEPTGAAGLAQDRSAEAEVGSAIPAKTKEEAA